MPYGLTLPFQVSSGSFGYFEMTNDEISAVNTDIRSLLLTNWGERPIHYSFGCNLIEFIFEQKSVELKDRIAERIMSQLRTWMPFLEIVTLNILFSDDSPEVPDNGIGVGIEFRLISKPDLHGTSFIIFN